MFDTNTPKFVVSCFSCQYKLFVLEKKMDGKAFKLVLIAYFLLTRKRYFEKLLQNYSDSHF